MRYRLRPIVGSGLACLAGCCLTVRAQSTDTLCPSRHGSDQSQSTPAVTIAEVSFPGSLQISASEQEQIAASITQRTYAGSPDDAKEEALERLRAAWQNRGYQKVEIVGGDATVLTSSTTGPRIALSVEVEEGRQYRLAGITFKNNRAISSVKALRAQFPIENGEIASRSAFGTGLENLRRVYGRIGYINFTPVPDIQIDDDSGLIHLDIDVDEGKQFYFGSVEFLGLEGQDLEVVSSEFPLKSGHVYDHYLVEKFLSDHYSLLAIHPSDFNRWSRRLDEHAGTIDLVLDVRRCADE